MNRRLKKFLIYFTSSILLSIFIVLLYSFIPKTLESFDDRLRDYMFILRGEVPNSKNVVIVDIDDKSLEQVGQWPWSRDTISNMLIKLTQSDVGLIGFDVVFPEEDRSNPVKIVEKLNIKTDKTIPNYDEIFANTISNTPTILGYQFQLSKDNHINKNVPQIPAIFIEKNINEHNKNSIINAYGTILNTPQIQDVAYSSGFFNNVPDESGIVRSVPLVIKYEDQVFPSLALEIIRIVSDKNKVYVNYDTNGVSNINVGNFNIPTDRYGRLLVNFRGYEKNFNYISAIDIINNKFQKEEVEGKIILIGTSAAGLLDLRSTPFESIFPGVEIHANVIDNILTGEYISKPSWAEGLNIIHIIILTFVTVLLIAYLKISKWLPIITILFFLDLYLIYNTLFTQGLVINILFPISTVIISTIVAVTLSYFLEIKQSRDIKNKFASKVSKDVMESLINNNKNGFSATNKEITIFFSDIRGFTNISESLPDPKVLIELLNEYMTPMSDIIIEESGTIDKFIGDAIMAYWNAPGEVENHQDKAVIATLKQLKKLKNLNNKIKSDKRFKDVVNMSKQKNIPIIDIGIGINTGEAIVGEMGSTQRSDYTVIGDSVNVASRLESLCKYYNSRCNISNYTKAKLKGDYIFRFLDLVTVKGKNEPVEIWQVIDFDEDENQHKLYDVAKSTLLEELKTYNNAIELYKNENFKDALDIFKALENNKNKTNKNIYKIYIDRCEHYIEFPPKEFDGVFKHQTKG